MYRTAAPRLCAVAALLLAALLLAACGGGSSGGGAGSAAADQPRGSSEPGRSATARTTAPARGATPGLARCRSLTAALLATLDRLRDRLVAGLDYRRYAGQMRRVRRAYDALPVGRLGIECLNVVGGPAEAAVNDYIGALNIWAGCVEVPGCQAASIEARLQRKWRLASRALSEAQRAVRGA